MWYIFSFFQICLWYISKKPLHIYFLLCWLIDSILTNVKTSYIEIQHFSSYLILVYEEEKNIKKLSQRPKGREGVCQHIFFILLNSLRTKTKKLKKFMLWNGGLVICCPIWKNPAYGRHRISWPIWLIAPHNLVFHLQITVKNGQKRSIMVKNGQLR